MGCSSLTQWCSQSTLVYPEMIAGLPSMSLFFLGFLARRNVLHHGVAKCDVVSRESNSPLMLSGLLAVRAFCSGGIRRTLSSRSTKESESQ